jgi:hypothetical protein
MRLDACLLADAATATPDGKLFIHGGGITRLTPLVLPWTHPLLGVVVRFEVEPGDNEQAHEISLRLVSPDGEQMPLPLPTITVTPERPAHAIEGEEHYVQLALGLAGITFQGDGIHVLELALNGDTIRGLRLAVIAPAQVPAPGG